MRQSVVNLFKHFFVLCFFATFFSCTSKGEEKTAAKNVPVKIQQITSTTENGSQEYIGTVEGDNMLDVSFLVMGNIEKMYVAQGQKVSKGQLLANVDKTSLKNTYDLSAATLKQAEDAHKRMKAMYESNSLPEIQYIEVKTKLEQATASETIARKNLEDSNIYAPQSGVIGNRYLEPGASVMPGTPVYQIVDISNVKIKTAIPEGEISNIKVGSECYVKISALRNETFRGKVIEKGILANPVSHTYDIKIQISNPEGKIMPGMVCRAYLNNEGSENPQIIVPLKSVQVDFSGQRFVWLKDKDSKAQYREVTLGRLSGNGVIISEGLNVGDELITEGYQNISKGTPVSVYNK